MEHRRPIPAPAQKTSGAAIAPQKKTAALSDRFLALFEQTQTAFSDPRVFEQARLIALAQLLCLGRHTVTGLLTTCGRTEQDWSSVYRIFEEERVDCRRIFNVACRSVSESIAPDAPFVAMMDDTLIRKRGRKVAGASWRRDPLGPPFHCNFVWGQRFLQLSAALPELPTGSARARAIPIAFEHCPGVKKPSSRATDTEWAEYRQQAKLVSVTRRGSEAVHRLRKQLDEDGQNRQLILAVDGTFTNRTVLTRLPERTTIIGRLRKDAKLYAPPPAEWPRRGRPRRYGEKIPTPEQIRQDESIPWISVSAFAAGRVHHFHIKTIAPCRWKNAGGRDIRLLVIRPLAYRPAKGKRLLYRDPAYLLCTDPQLGLEQVVQFYAWRWEIELNFREEKTLLGAGEAQVRVPQAVAALPAFKVAVYALLLLASNAMATEKLLPPPRPKWQERTGEQLRLSTGQLIGRLRVELWGKALGVENNEGFMKKPRAFTKPMKIENAAPQAVIYAYR